LQKTLAKRETVTAVLRAKLETAVQYTEAGAIGRSMTALFQIIIFSIRLDVDTTMI